MIAIRNYADGDLDAVVELMEELGYPSSLGQMRERMARIGAEQGYATFVAVHDGKVAGMIGVRRLIGYEGDEPVVQISALVTRSTHRGLGIGKRLVMRAEAWAEEHGAVVLVLTSGSRPEREEAHRFYAHLGFAATGARFSKRLNATS